VSIDEAAIWDKINLAETRMSLPQRRLWEVVRITPERWQDRTGNSGDGIWVVAVIGTAAIWYNEIEEGFCRSSFSSYGEVSKFNWNADPLGDVLQYVLDEISTGERTEPYVSSPMAGEYPGRS
jgi:hypothetical protein